MHLGLQMYSVRDITKDDLAGALAKVGKIGYDNAEFAGFFGHSADEVKKMLADAGMKVSGTHTGWTELAENLDETIKFHQAIGNTRLIVPFADLSTKAKLDQLIDLLNDVQPKLAAAGIKLGYHNHAFEFKANEDGLIPFDEIVARTKIFLEVDTFWAYAAGRDPLEVVRTNKDRIPVVHIKDGLAGGEGKPLGQGTAPAADVWKLARELGIDLVVESETLTPDGLTEAEICYKFVESLEKK